MRVVLDTNVLLRAAQPGHPHAKLAREAVEKLIAADHETCLVPQTIYEFWVVATRPQKENGLEMSVAGADAEVDRLLSLNVLLEDTPEVFPGWRGIVRKHQVSGKKAHDARIAAAMLAHGVSHILTFNHADFVRFSGITAIPAAASADA
jgi:predicted nucleic acid-binding protein